jgi:hypothetical protein
MMPFGELYGLLIGAAGVLLAVVVAWFNGRAAARKQLKSEQNAQLVKDIKTKEKVRDGVEVLDDVELAARARKYLRRDE